MPCNRAPFRRCTTSTSPPGYPSRACCEFCNTLERAGLVSRRLADGHYRISALGRMARKRDRFDRVAEAAAPVLDRLCQKVLWPSDLLVPAGDHMERRETSRSHSPFPIHSAHELNRVGQPVGWLLSAVGRAYLAFCPEKEREGILRRLRKSNKLDDLLAHEPETPRQDFGRDASEGLRHARFRFRWRVLRRSSPR